MSHSRSPTLKRRVAEAERVFQLLCNRARDEPGPQLPCDEWHECERLARLLDRCRARHWRAAERIVRTRLANAVGALAGQLAFVRGDLLTQPPASPCVTRGDVLADLAALAAEFSSVTLEAGELVVGTEPIELENFWLGPFELRFDLARRTEGEGALRVVALEPSPARLGDDVTHPHVSGERLCAGDGRLPLAKALAEGRLLDAVTIAAQVLRSYNPDSAYVALDDWDGVSCSECGEVVDGDAATSCAACNDDVCRECAVTCEECDDLLCSHCATTCHGCSAVLCSHCADACAVCGQLTCEACRDDDRRCPDCRAPETNDDEEEPRDSDADALAAAPAAGPPASAADVPRGP